MGALTTDTSTGGVILFLGLRGYRGLVFSNALDIMMLIVYNILRKKFKGEL
jgi:hypothetical protein